jgi:hypothetical protein
VGSKWVYKNTQNADWERTDVITAVEEEDGAKVIRVGTLTRSGTVEQRQTMRLSPRGLFQLNVTREDPGASTCFLKLPIRFGASWECLVGGTRGVATCEGIEEVGVPAGRFKAVKVVARWKTQNLAGGEASGWFVPGIGPVKWQRGDGAATVLHSFTAGDEK